MDVEKITTENHYMPLASWIPQLSGAPFAMYSQAGIPGLKMGRKNADPLVGLPSLTHRNYNAAETKKIDMKTFRFRKRTSNGLNHFSLYVKGFEFDTIDKVQNSSQGGAIPSEWADFGGWPLGTGVPPDEFWRTIVADRGRDGKNPPVYYARACKESFEKGGYVSGAVNTTDLINNERCSVIAQFCRRVQAVIWNRALVRTKSGKLGLAGPNVQPGDKVCILYGCSVPVILRKSEEKREEIMEGEIAWELQYLKKQLAECYRAYVRRREFFQQKWKDDKAKYKQWEMTKREEWKRSRTSKEWRKKWKKDTEEKEAKAKSLVVKKSTAGVLKIRDRKVYVQHCRELFWYCIMRIDREFDAWKRGKRAEKKEREQRRKQGDKAMTEEDHAWDEPNVNWREFELSLRYFRRWKKRTRDVKESIRKEVEAEMKKRTEGKGQEKGQDHVHEAEPELVREQRKKKLTEEQKEEYEAKLRENVKRALGKDRFYSYQLYGECYIHGMMDGEAMSVQNGNSGDENAKPIDSTVFEIRHPTIKKNQRGSGYQHRLLPNLRLRRDDLPGIVAERDCLGRRQLLKRPSTSKPLRIPGMSSDRVIEAYRAVVIRCAISRSR
ncbi:uncharacterized protein A1O9_05480 [Exophiala aquamarina CBS 119918]|uniref:Uncharacterized protein n=1 Tax=Exophiala aquamarina CBS 119918 TaxID=1182545 RepID=A0A072PCQ3_9EURO|nr:uncharacterized protein A1O9_05480 [Exophiala aquamarina CBS 119918]KEF57562.1 hypothetical protein A1O9_05480 [Exophiala aquamarina CBS 119918]